MDNHDSDDLEINVARAPPINSTPTGCFARHRNTATQERGTTTISAETPVHDVTTTSKTTRIIACGNSSDSFSLPPPGRVAPTTVVSSENTTSEIASGSGASSSTTSAAERSSFVGLQQSRATTKQSLRHGILLTAGNRRNEIDCDELEETMGSTSVVAGNDTVREYFEDDLYIEKSRRANPSGNHATVDTLGKYFEDDLFAEKIRRADPSGNHAVDTGGDPGGNAAVQAEFEGNLLPKKRQMENQSYVSYLDEDPPSSDNPSCISYLEEPPPSDSLLAVDLEPMPMPAPPNIGIVPQHRPGECVYNAEASGANLQRLEHPNDEEDDNNVDNDVDFRNRNDFEDDMDVQGDNNGRTEAEVPTNAILARPSNTDLAVAQAIEEEDDDVAMEAKEIDPGKLQKKEIDKKKRRDCRIVGCVIIVICCIILGLSLGLSLRREEETAAPSTSQPNTAPTQSPTRPLPPMENLELLYDELPEKTREGLYSSTSPQYQAWEWLLNHPDITSYPEWRKKQVFAMVTFFYSFEGPYWPEQIRNKWLNVTASECHWTLSKDEVLYFTQEAALTFGPDAYSFLDIQPCNQNGELQNLFVTQLDNMFSPSMPPQIGLLTSLKILGILFSDLDGSKLSDFLVPELMEEMPNLVLLIFYRTGLGGTIPKGIGRMTGLRHLTIGDNQLTGTMPTEIAKMSSLEYLDLLRNDITGSIPSELGGMTSLTHLEIDDNHFTGTIPSELGLIATIQQFWLQNNAIVR